MTTFRYKQAENEEGMKFQVNFILLIFGDSISVVKPIDNTQENGNSNRHQQRNPHLSFNYWLNLKLCK